MWGGEFGRTPFFQGALNEKAGRDHNPWGFTMFMAGGGVKGGQTIGIDRRARSARGRGTPSHLGHPRVDPLPPRARSPQDDVPAQRSCGKTHAHGREADHQAVDLGERPQDVRSASGLPKAKAGALGACLSRRRAGGPAHTAFSSALPASVLPPSRSLQRSTSAPKRNRHPPRS